jgi:hypothetical protein
MNVSPQECPFIKTIVGILLRERSPDRTERINAPESLFRVYRVNNFLPSKPSISPAYLFNPITRINQALRSNNQGAAEAAPWLFIGLFQFEHIHFRSLWKPEAGWPVPHEKASLPVVPRATRKVKMS